jgi:hypothetical protein
MPELVDIITFHEPVMYNLVPADVKLLKVKVHLALMAGSINLINNKNRMNREINIVTIIFSAIYIGSGVHKTGSKMDTELDTEHLRFNENIG